MVRTATGACGWVWMVAGVLGCGGGVVHGAMPVDAVEVDLEEVVSGDVEAPQDEAFEDAVEVDWEVDEVWSEVTGDTGPDLSACGVGDDEKVRRHAAIFYGTSVPELFEIGAGRQNAVVSIVALLGNFCTGTLVSPFVVVTAAHCVADLDHNYDAMIAVGPDALQPQAALAMASFQTHPNYDRHADTAIYDVAVVVLAEAATSEVADLIPIPFSRTPMDASMIGKKVQNAGFGMSDQSYDNSDRWWVAEPVYEVLEGDFAVDGEGEHGICFGDSGGPSLYDDGTGLRLLGVVSYGEGSCVGIDHFADVGYVADWIEGFVRDSMSCGNVGDAGLCDGGTARWCEAGQMKALDCAQMGLVCGRDEADRARCVENPCRAMTRAGHCLQGDVAAWCEDGVPRFRHCRPCGQVCGFAGDDLGYYCVDADEHEPAMQVRHGHVIGVP